jgi:hypothetical protein
MTCALVERIGFCLRAANASTASICCPKKAIRRFMRALILWKNNLRQENKNTGTKMKFVAVPSEDTNELEFVAQ